MPLPPPKQESTSNARPNKTPTEEPLPISRQPVKGPLGTGGHGLATAAVCVHNWDGGGVFLKDGLYRQAGLELTDIHLLCLQSPEITDLNQHTWPEMCELSLC